MVQGPCSRGKSDQYQIHANVNRYTFPELKKTFFNCITSVDLDTFKMMPIPKNEVFLPSVDQLPTPATSANCCLVQIEQFNVHYIID